jgi:uncharacterized protein YaaN involved in tellurite resistance
VLSTQLDPTNQADPAAKRMAELTEFAANMQGKISEYKGRFFIGWSGAPRMLKMRSLDIGIALKLNEYDVSVIPMMQEIANLLAMQARSADATGLLEETSKSYNDMAVMLADKSAAGMANTARVLAAPTLKVETIQHIAAKFIEGTDNVLAAFQAGEIARGEAYEAMETSGKLISAQNQKISTQQIQSIIGSATSPLPLEITAG